MNGRNSGLIHCLQGNLCAALIDLGCLDDPRLGEALDWLARSVQICHRGLVLLTIEEPVGFRSPGPSTAAGQSRTVRRRSA